MSSDRLPALYSTEATALQNAVKIGRDLETGQDIFIGDEARRAGLYVLGRTRMGKTNLLLHLADADIRNGHGVFFLDPHGDAIEDLVAQHCSYEPIGDGAGGTTGSGALSYNTELRILNTQNVSYSFGINLLACRNPANLDAYNETYTRAYSVFEKIWQIEWETKPWLQKITQHTILAFIENQEFTLAEVPMFLDLDNSDYTRFREYVVGNIKQNEAVADFWRFLFRAKKLEDQQREVDAALTRVQTLLADRYVRNIVGQKETTVDFADIIENKRVLLIKLSARLAKDSKKFLGTIILSELLHAVRNRDKLPARKRHQFCIFVDEFQNFASSEDFPVLFTQAGKLGVATAVAHQERAGQLAENRAIAGATDAAGNKVLFQLSNQDAREFAPEFAKDPPEEIKYEPEFVVSRRPVDALLEGHGNPELYNFALRYFFPLKDRRDNTKEDIEDERLQRQLLLDEAALSRIDERREAHFASLARGRDIPVPFQAINTTEQLLLLARERTERMLSLHRSRIRARLTIEKLNAYMVAIMEGRFSLIPGQKQYSDFLLACVQSFAYTPVYYIDFQPNPLALYISLTYGDPETPQTIKLDFAKKYSLVPGAVAATEALIADLRRQHREARTQSFLTYQTKVYKEGKADRQESERNVVERRRRKIANWTRDVREINVIEALQCYILICQYPKVAALLSEYHSARFASDVQFGDYWKHYTTADPNWQVQALLDQLKYIREANKRFAKDARKFRGFGFDGNTHSAEVAFADFLLDSFAVYLTSFKEGALVALSLLLTLEHPLRWGSTSTPFEGTLCLRTWKRGYVVKAEELDDNYVGHHSLYLPPLANREPLEVLLTLEKLEEILAGCNIEADCPGYYEVTGGLNAYTLLEGLFMVGYCSITVRSIYGSSVEKLLVKNSCRYKGYLHSLLTPDKRSEVHRLRQEMTGFQREMALARALGAVLYFELPDGRKIHGAGSQLSWWRSSPQLVRTCLELRACDLYMYGEAVANRTFPQPTIKGVDPEKVAAVVAYMVQVLEESDRRDEEREDQEWQAETVELLEKHLEWDEKDRGELGKLFGNEYVFVNDELVWIPKYLPPLVLTGADREAVRLACRDELLHGEESRWGKWVLDIIDELIRFCTLLSKPENHVVVPGGRYVAKATKPSRTPGEMQDEMVKELTRLNPHEAYAKAIQQNGGEQSVYIGKIQTVPPFPKPEWADEMDDLVTALTEQAEPDEDGVHTAVVNMEGKEQRLWIAPGSNWARLITSTIELRTAVVHGMCKERALIREEIRQRQAPWRTGETLLLPRPLKGPPPTHF